MIKGTQRRPGLKQAGELLDHVDRGHILVMRPNDPCPSGCVMTTSTLFTYPYSLRRPTPHGGQTMCRKEAVEAIRSYNGSITPYD